MLLVSYKWCTLSYFSPCSVYWVVKCEKITIAISTFHSNCLLVVLVLALNWISFCGNWPDFQTKWLELNFSRRQTYHSINCLELDPTAVLQPPTWIKQKQKVFSRNKHNDQYLQFGSVLTLSAKATTMS